jgi:phage replication-related protein YjqB (UPF0714/DUF867 family)
MVKAYKSFGELSEREREGQDYRIETCFTDNRVLVMAPHGGQIEPGTTEIAEAIARDDFSFYSFEGIKPNGNGVLHIESHLFDEPRALEAVRGAEIVLTVHGQAGNVDEFVMLGGLNTGLKSETEHALNRSGFRTLKPTEGLRAIDGRNICNRGRSGKGVQLEVSRGLRDLLQADKDRLREFADAVRRGVRLYLEQVDPS